MEFSQQELWEAVQQHGGVRPAGRVLGIPESSIRRHLKGFEPELPSHAFIPDPRDLPASHVGDEGVETWDYWKRQQEDKRVVARYILTSAQNNCDVHRPFLRNLEALAKKFSADILVSFTIYDRQGYRGLTAKGDARVPRREVWWDKAIQPYAVNVRCQLSRRLLFCGELDILATTKNPLSSLESYCGRSSLLVPHNKFSFKCVESRPHQMPKEMMTTGSVTTKRFIQRKAGQLAQFHHVLGALLVEVTEDGHWYTHHLNAEDDGSFYWLDHQVKDGKVRKNREGIEAVILGDIHHEKLRQEQADLAFGMIQDLQPKHILIHDLIDFKSRNHHNRDDALFRIKMLSHHNVETELWHAGRYLDQLELAAPDARIAVVASNHDSAYTRWIKETDWRSDPVNARFYLRTAYEMVGRAEHGLSMNPLEWAIQHYHKLAPRALFLHLDESYEVKGIECGMHGHVGPSGARGNPRAFSKLGFKTFTGHTHSPSIVDGCYTVGVLGSLQMGYNKGPSKWMHTHGIIYPNGKRAFLFMKNGKYRA